PEHGRGRGGAAPEGRRARAQIRHAVQGRLRRDPGAHGTAAGRCQTPHRLPTAVVTYVELSARSAFSFLAGASSPEALIDEAARLELPAVALADVDGVYGAPRFHKAARVAGVRPLVGAALTLANGTRLGLLVEFRAGYRALGRLVTRVKARAPKGQARATPDDPAGAGEGLVCLTRGGWRRCRPA